MRNTHRDRQLNIDYIHTDDIDIGDTEIEDR